MKSYTKHIKSLTIILEEDEANWLKGLVQNPLHDDHNEESQEDARMRKLFYEALKEI